MSNLQQNLKQILYEDDTVKITKDQVTILKYYFPIPAAKTIKMQDIVAIHLRDNTDGQMWGTTPQKIDTWFALDSQRYNKKQYLQLVIRDSDIKAAFSPSQPKKVMQIIQSNATMSLAQKQTKFGYGQPQKHIPNIQQPKNINIALQSYQKKLNQPLITEWDKPITSQFKQQTQIKKVKKQVPRGPHTGTVKQKGVLESIGDKFNQKVQGLKNVGAVVKEKYKEGKQNAIEQQQREKQLQRIKQIQKGKENVAQETQYVIKKQKKETII